MNEPVTVPAFVDRCVFMNGEHVYQGADCTHGRSQDEQGEIKPTGWTVQQ